MTYNQDKEQQEEVMNTRLGKISFVILLLLPLCSNATDITFTSSGSIVNGNIFGRVTVQNNDTIVNMSGGQIGVDFTGGLNMWNSSTFNMSGGSISGSIFNNPLSNLNISNGTINIGDLVVYDRAILNISGGNITVSRLKTYPRYLTSPASVININGGIVNFDGVNVDGTLNIYRGLLSINSFNYWGTQSANINIYGSGFNYNPSTQILTGYLLDSNPFTIKAVSSIEYARFNLVPEPATLLLLSLGGLALRSRRNK
jgi:hypothetical protein